MRARAELHRTKLRGEEELRKEQKEAESQKVSSQHATRPKRGSDSSIALKKPQIPSVTIDAGSPEVKRTPEQRGQKEEEQDLPRRLRNTLEGDSPLLEICDEWPSHRLYVELTQADTNALALNLHLSERRP
jgi:hypothetical protein